MNNQKEHETIHHRIIGVNYKTGIVEFLDTTFYRSPRLHGATGYSFSVYNKRHPQAKPNNSQGQGLLMQAFSKLPHKQKRNIVNAINRAEQREGYMSGIFIPFESVEDFEANALTYCCGFGRIGAARAQSYWDDLQAWSTDDEALHIILEAENANSAA